VLDQVNVDEHPAFADLRARNLAGACLLLERYRMNVQKCGSGLQIERVHARTLWACVAEILSTQVHGGDLLAAMAHLTADRLPRLAIDFLLLRRELF
jgi:hypothetical protein